MPRPSGRIGPRPLLSLALAGLIGGLLALLGGRPLPGQQVLQQGFEARDPLWVQRKADAPFKELAHRLTDDFAHTGHRSEFIQLSAEPGNYIHYSFDPGRAPIDDVLNVSLFLRANRPGAQLLCRVVLPNERDPNNLEQPLTVVVKGDVYQLAGRWQQLSLHQPVKRLKEQQQLLRAELKRDVVIADAYVDRLLLNLYSGPGQTDVWIDDLEVGPLLDPPGGPPVARSDGGPPAAPTGRSRLGEVQFKGDQLYVGDKKCFLRAVRHTGTPLKALRDARFNAVFLDESTPPEVVEEAVSRGFLIVPMLNPPTQVTRDGGPPEGALTSTEAFARKVSRFLSNDGLLAWDLGSNLTAEQYPAAKRTAQLFQSADPTRIVCVDVWDGFARYSRILGDAPMMLGMHRWPLLTSLELSGYRDWLTQRRLQAAPNANAFYWTWVQTHLPEWFTTLAYGRGAGGKFDEPIGPQAEQIRLLAYTAVGCGYRGLGFWSDRFLADSHTGRDRLLALALLNQELEMLEPLLAAAEEPYWIDTSNPFVKAALLRCDNSVLVLPIWMGPGSQYVPGQAALAQLSITVPQVPSGSQAWEVSPGQVRALKWERVLGGVKITLNEFDLTAAVVFTSDLTASGPVVRFQEKQLELAPKAAQWAHDQAKEELAKVEKVQAELEQMGQTPPDARALLDKARSYLESAERHKANGNHAERYADAQRALRPLRLLMRAEWERAIRGLDAPVSSPYALSYYTLPRHFRFWGRLGEAKATANALSDGDFELSPDQTPRGWLVEEVPSLDDVEATVRRVSNQPHAGKQCLMLQLSPKKKNEPPPVSLERSFVALHSPTVQLQPGSLVRITAWVRIPRPLTGSPDGAEIYDSIGGEALAVRLVGPTTWHRYTVYREVPAAGKVSVTLALTGLGEAYFDDVKIEPLAAREAATATAAR